MPIRLCCYRCGRKIQVDDTFAGSLCRCAHCGALSEVPTLAGADESDRPSRAAGKGAAKVKPGGTTLSAEKHRPTPAVVREKHPPSGHVEAHHHTSASQRFILFTVGGVGLALVVMIGVAIWVSMGSRNAEPPPLRAEAPTPTAPRLALALPSPTATLIPLKPTAVLPPPSPTPVRLSPGEPTPTVTPLFLPTATPEEQPPPTPPPAPTPPPLVLVWNQPNFLGVPIKPKKVVYLVESWAKAMSSQYYEQTAAAVGHSLRTLPPDSRVSLVISLEIEKMEAKQNWLLRDLPPTPETIEQFRQKILDLGKVSQGPQGKALFPTAARAALVEKPDTLVTVSRFVQYWGDIRADATKYPATTMIYCYLSMVNPIQPELYKYPNLTVFTRSPGEIREMLAASGK